MLRLVSVCVYLVSYLHSSGSLRIKRREEMPLFPEGRAMKEDEMKGRYRLPMLSNVESPSRNQNKSFPFFKCLSNICMRPAFAPPSRQNTSFWYFCTPVGLATAHRHTHTHTRACTHTHTHTHVHAHIPTCLHTQPCYHECRGSAERRTESESVAAARRRVLGF